MVDAIGGAGAVIGVDNGLIHLGASMATPTVAIFGPMPAWLWGPRGDIHINIQGDCKIDCTRQPMDWRCDSQICTNAISPIEVFNSLEELGVRD
jgi:ADP-heptose:LPS heptosyltransferase